MKFLMNKSESFSPSTVTVYQPSVILIAAPVILSGAKNLGGPTACVIQLRFFAALRMTSNRTL